MDLNPRQLEAVNYQNGPLLIIAGAGSGKTRTLTSRLIKLLESGALANEVAAITFTNKAAEEMRNRITHNLQPKTNNTEVSGHKFSVVSQLFIGTFHSFGARILKKEAQLFRRTPNYTIYDDDDSLSLIKKILSGLNVAKDKNRPFQFRNYISKIKNELLTAAEFGDELETEIYRLYEAALVKNNAFDFDDLIEKPVRLFFKNPRILEKYQNQFRYLLVDEYQDINTAQYQLIKLLAQKHRNLSAVGDDQQCFPAGTKILTTTGFKSIEKISVGDKVITAAGHGNICSNKVLKIYKRHYQGPLVKITSDNSMIRATPNHLVFSRLQLLPISNYFVYLMYRKDKGFRIGIARGTRKASKNGKQELQVGLLVRCNQEKADKIWIIKICKTREDAEYYEYYYGFKYGIPTLVFDTGNRPMKLSQKHIDLIFKNIDTTTRVKSLMRDKLLYFTHPHWIPQGTVRHRKRRLRIRVSLLDDKRIGLTHPWGMSRISVNTKDNNLKTAIEKLGFNTRKGKLADWRFEKCSMSYDQIESVTEKFTTINAEIEIIKTACLTNGKRLFFQPISHLRPSMITAVYKNRRITEAVVKDTRLENYKGNIYDLDVKNTHNYIANNFVVHNSIYGFRGSDFRNFLNFEKDWPNAKVVKLEQNYRSSATIISAASQLIKNNLRQKPKNLWTENAAGEPIKIVKADDPETEADFIAQTIKQLKSYGQEPTVDELKGFKFVNPPTHQLINSPTVSILYRTNAQSRALESALIQNNIPYRIYGGLKFYERKEIKDVIAGLRLVFNPNDGVSAERLEKNLTKNLYRNLRSELSGYTAKNSILELINVFLSASRYFDRLEQKFGNAQERRENINELIAFAGQFNNLGEFLERVSLFQSSDAPAKTLVASGYTLNPINLMTIHLAKGLEFDYVFVAGANEGVLPHQMSYGSKDELEEERRLMYVAMTRAKKDLYLTLTEIPSRFLYEIPPELTRFINLSGGDSDALPDEEEIYID